MLVLHSFALAVGIFLVVIVLRDAFQTIVLPRRPSGSLRFTRYYYIVSWFGTRWLAHRLKPAHRDAMLSWYGPFWMIGIVGSWALVLMLAFGIIHWGAGSNLTLVGGERSTFWTDVYMSGTTFFTLGMGDIYPANVVSRFISVIEAGLGLTFLAMVIGYLPVLYSSFSRREMLIALMDARAGSPPSAGELFGRTGIAGKDRLLHMLEDFEGWCGELLESHLSYPVLAYYRSQHDHQSWISTITAVMDICAVILAAEDNAMRPQARLTFAIARHAIVDLMATFGRPEMDGVSRLQGDELAELERIVRAAGFTLGPNFAPRLSQIRATYEPIVASIADHLLLPLPHWLPAANQRDDWQSFMADVEALA
jgi:hypothetical protein